MSLYKKLKELTWSANQELVRQGLVMFTFGNVSAFDPDRGIMAIKPSGVPYDKLEVRDICLVDLEGTVIEGAKKPSSDTPTHLFLYKKFPKLGGIAHTHSVYASSWAQAGKDIPVLGTTHADYLASPVPCTVSLSQDDIKKDYEKNTGRLIAKFFSESGLDFYGTKMILVRGHGPFTWGPDPLTAAHNSKVLEEIAKAAVLTKQINPDVKPIDPQLMNKHYSRKHGKNAYYGQ